MANGRTINAGKNGLTKKDKDILKLCKKIIEVASKEITDKEIRKKFMKEYGNVDFSRDAGLGRGGGKIQRDALCTRGITSKGPFSNRNLRWHPLVVSKEKIDHAEEIERIEIEGEDDCQILHFLIKEGNKTKSYLPEEVYKLKKRYCITQAKFQPWIETIKTWNQTVWTQNSCVITAYEACDWNDAVESFAVLTLSILCDDFKLNFNSLYGKVCNVLKKQKVDTSITLPSEKFPTDEKDIICCPLCKEPHTEAAAKIENRERAERFHLELSKSKRNEGEDDSLQIMHIEPLIEDKIKHNAKNVRYGHRWCNVSMTDHNIDETIDFMKFILSKHPEKANK